MADSTLQQAARFLAPTAALITSGVYTCSSQLALPLLYGLPIEISTAGFSNLYHRGLVIVASLSALGALSSATVAYASPTQRSLYTAAGLATIAPLAWTRLFMMGTVGSLLVLSDNSAERQKVAVRDVDALLATWQQMNWFRAGFSLIGGALAVVGLMDTSK